MKLCGRRGSNPRPSHHNFRKPLYHVTQTQHDQIGDFWKFLAANFLTKVGQKHWWLFGLVWKVSLYVKTNVASIWATFGNIWGTFLLQYLVTLLRLSMVGKGLFTWAVFDSCICGGRMLCGKLEKYLFFGTATSCHSDMLQMRWCEWALNTKWFS